MKTTMTFLTATIIAVSILTSFGRTDETSKSNEIIESTEKESLATHDAIPNEIKENTEVIKNSAKNESESEASERTEIMTLISGASFDCTTIIFKKSNGAEILAGEIPENIKWIEEDYGGSNIDPKLCNKKYKVTYTMKKYYCESDGEGEGSLQMNVSVMVPV